MLTSEIINHSTELILLFQFSLLNPTGGKRERLCGAELPAGHNTISVAQKPTLHPSSPQGTPSSPVSPTLGHEGVQLL